MQELGYRINAYDKCVLPVDGVPEDNDAELNSGTLWSAASKVRVLCFEPKGSLWWRSTTCWRPGDRDIDG